MDNLNKLELRSEEVQEILTKVPHWMIRWGSVLFLSILVIGLTLSWFIRYPDIVACGAIVTTKAPLQNEYAKVACKFDTILVKDREMVRSNQPVAILENTADFQDVLFLQTIIDTMNLSNKKFYFPIDGIPVLFLGEINSDYALFENSYLQYRLNEKLIPFSNESLTSKTSLSELKSQLTTLHSERDSRGSELELKKRDFERNKVLFKEGEVSASEYERYQLEYLLAEKVVKSTNDSVLQISEAISNATKRTRGNVITKAKEEMILLRNVIQSFNQLKKSIKDWERRYVLKSDINGTISFFRFWTKSQRFSQGDPIFTIIPNNSPFVAKLKTRAQNLEKIKVGEKVNIKLEQYPEDEFGTITGKVYNISLIPDKNGLYLIDVSLPQDLVTSYGKKIDFKQEMRGEANIVTDNMRLLERFFYGFKNVLSR